MISKWMWFKYNNNIVFSILTDGHVFGSHRRYI